MYIPIKLLSHIGYHFVSGHYIIVEITAKVDDNLSMFGFDPHYLVHDWNNFSFFGLLLFFDRAI